MLASTYVLPKPLGLQPPYILFWAKIFVHSSLSCFCGIYIHLPLVCCFLLIVNSDQYHRVRLLGGHMVTRDTLSRISRLYVLFNRSTSCCHIICYHAFQSILVWRDFIHWLLCHRLLYLYGFQNDMF